MSFNELYSTQAKELWGKGGYSGKGVYNDRSRDGMEFLSGEIAADNALQRQLSFVESQPQAYIQGLRNAGLSPSVFASGQTGSSGTSGVAGSGGGGNTGGSQAAQAISNAVYNTASLATNIAKQKAEVELINAQTENVKEQTLTEQGANNRGAAEIDNILKDTIGKTAATQFTQTQTKATEWQNYITSNSADYDIKRAKYLSEQAANDAERTYWTARNEQKNFEYNESTFNTRVEKEKQEWINLQKDAILKDAQTKLTQEQQLLIEGELSMLYDESMRKWAALDIEEQKLDINKTDMYKRHELLNKEIDNFERRLEQKDKELRIANRNSWFNNINSSIRTIAYSASTVASFMGKQSTTIPPVLDLTPPSTIYY